MAPVWQHPGSWAPSGSPWAPAPPCVRAGHAQPPSTPPPPGFSHPPFKIQFPRNWEQDDSSWCPESAYEVVSLNPCSVRALAGPWDTAATLQADTRSVSMTAGRLSALLSLLVLGKAPSPVWASVFSPGAPWVGWPPSAFEDCSSRTAKQRPSENQQIRGLLARYVYCVVRGESQMEPSEEICDAACQPVQPTACCPLCTAPLQAQGKRWVSRVGWAGAWP